MRLEEARKELLKNPEFKKEYYKPHVGDELRLLRRMRGLKQWQLAEMVGTKQPSIARMEKDGYQASIGLIYRCAEALGYHLKIEFIEEQIN